jgi:hypothetical protein
MKSSPMYTLYLEPFRLWSAVAWKVGEMMLASAQVIGYRSRQSPGAANARELALMSGEKVAAGAESAQAVVFDSMMLGQKLGAMAVRQMSANMAAFMSLMTSRSVGQSVSRHSRIVQDTLRDSAVAGSQLSRSGARMVQKSLKPMHSRATANARRLGKKRPR